MAHSSYRQFCPVAMAAEILCRRWMMLVIRELVAGTTRFNDLRRGVPKMSRQPVGDAAARARGFRRDRAPSSVASKRRA